MTLANFDLYFHMANHYKKIKKAKAVVDCSSPQGYNTKQCNNRRQSPAPPSCTSRNCNPCVYECRPSRPTCTPRQTQFQRCCSAPPISRNCDLQDFNSCRRSSQLHVNFGPSISKVPLHKRNDSKFKSKIGKSQVPLKLSTREKMEKKVISPDRLGKPQNVESPTESAKEKVEGDKQKVEDAEIAPKNRENTPTEEPDAEITEYMCLNLESELQESEYVHFLLKITEDILRNSIYNEEELEKLFQSHIDANKGRLDEDRMHAQIDHLKEQMCYPLQKRDSCHDESNPLFCPAHQIKDKHIEVDPNEICPCSNPHCVKYDLVPIQAKDKLQGSETGDEKPKMDPIDAGTNEAVMDVEKPSTTEQEPFQSTEPIQGKNEMDDICCGSESCIRECKEKKNGTKKEPQKELISSPIQEDSKKSILSETKQEQQMISVGSQIGEPKQLSVASQIAEPEQISIGTQTGEPEQSSVASQIEVPKQSSIGFQIGEPKQSSVGSQMGEPKQPIGHQICEPKQSSVASQIEVPKQSSIGFQIGEPKQSLVGSRLSQEVKEPLISSEENIQVIPQEMKKPSISSQENIQMEPQEIKEPSISSQENVKVEPQELPERSISSAEQHLITPDSVPVVKETQHPPETFIDDNKGKGECLDPDLCHQPFDRNKFPAPLPKTSVSAASSSPRQGVSAHSIVKITPKDNTHPSGSQMVLYSPNVDQEQNCCCNVTLQKTALKIQVDDPDEEYVLVNGPVCMPRSMLETKTITVLIQNVSSIVLSLSETVETSDVKTLLSQVNFLQHENPEPNQVNMDSISGNIVGKDIIESDYDTRPQRELEDVIASCPMLKKSVKSDDSPTKGLSLQELDDQQKENATVAGEPSYPKGEEDGPNLEKPARGSIQKGQSRPGTNCSSRKCVSNTLQTTNPDLTSAERSFSSGTLPFVIKDKVEDSKNELPPFDNSSGVRGSISGLKNDEADKDKRSSSDQFKINKESAEQDEPSFELGSIRLDNDPSKDVEPITPDKLDIPFGDAPSSRRSSAEKYHYLLMDAATSISSCAVHVPRVHTSHGSVGRLDSNKLFPPSTKRSSLLDEFKLLINEQYEVETLLPVEPPLKATKSSLKVPSVDRLRTSPQEDFYYEENATSNESLKLGEPENNASDNLFHSPDTSVAQSEVELTYPARQMSGSIKDDVSDVESFRRPSLVEEHEISSVQSTELNQPRTISKTSTKGQEGLKLKSSAKQDPAMARNQEIINKLDELSGLDQNKIKDDNIADLNEKMKEFRKIEDDDNANRRFQITNPENFEIRRVSVLENTPEEQEVDKNKKKKPKCCGIGSKEKGRRSS